jgi:hypothetical protein
MAAKRDVFSQLQSSLVHLSNSKAEQSGKPPSAKAPSSKRLTHLPAFRIYKPAKPATQSGDWHSHHWRMDWDILSKGHRWENPLMGWQSSADFMQGTHLNFKSKEDAINFAEKQGYEYFVQEPNERKFVPKAYANNFLYTPGKLKHIRTK